MKNTTGVYSIEDLEKVLKNNINEDQTFILQIENKKVYLLHTDGFNRKEIELLYTNEEGELSLHCECPTGYHEMFQNCRGY